VERALVLSSRTSRIGLALAALDALAGGLWLAAWPADLLHALQAAPTHDALLLTRALGALTLLHVPCLALAAMGPTRYLGLLWPPLLGRMFQAGLWLWLLALDRTNMATQFLWFLLSRDILWLAIVAFGGLAMRRALAQGVQP
jgi:hypothetical protein